MEKGNFDYRRNSFDIIRYFAAFSVMFLHYTYYAITISGRQTPLLQGMRRFTEFFPGVIILFSLSGFLISASFERCITKKEFFIKRIFRLYPELWLCTLVNLILLFLLVRESLDGSLWLWVLTQIVGIANTPSCLSEFATGSVNGALWTIFTEIQLYLVLGIFYPMLKKLKNNSWWILLGGCLFLNLGCRYVTDNFSGIMGKLVERTVFPYLAWFLIGVYCYQRKRELIPVLKKYFWLLFGIFAFNQYFNLCEAGYYEDIITSCFLPFVTIGAAYLLPVKRISCDLSYGIFLYHWIVINVMVYLNIFILWPWYWCMLLFIFLTLGMALVSQVFGKNIKTGKRIR